ncbi:MAG: hypothetical protein ACI4TT_04300 [Christensenellales bacterium]
MRKKKNLTEEKQEEKKVSTKKAHTEAVANPQPTLEQPKTTDTTVAETEGSVLDYIKKEFFKNNPDASEDGIGAGFFKEDIFHIDFENQNEYFSLLKGLFTPLNIQKPQMSLERYANAYYDTLEMVTEMAVCGCVPAMDYLCFIYKKGVDDVLPVNLVRAHEWGMLAIAGGSKLSPDRLRMFLDPVYTYIMQNDLLPGILKKHPTTDDEEVINYVAYNFANIFNEKKKLTLEYMSKKDIISDEGFQVFLKEAYRVRDESLPIMAKYIA